MTNLKGILPARKDEIINGMIRNELEVCMEPSALLKTLRRYMTDEEIEAFGYGYLFDLDA